MWEKKPVLLLVLATLAILVGTVITMILPFRTVNQTDRITEVKPYTALQLAGRDVYIREGCNNCHSQTVRPLIADVLRYGDYSKSGEFLYDQPHLWGSRRMGPDLARIGGKYPDAWHYKHMEDPPAMIPKSNMPSYAFIADNKIDPTYTEKKMKVLGFPYTTAEIKSLDGKTEMDAIVAYMQKLGSDIGWREAAASEVVGELKNPAPGDAAAIASGREIYVQNCQVCHGANLEGDIARELSELDVNDAVLFMLINNGIEDEMPAFANIGAKKIWQLVNYLNYGVMKKDPKTSNVPITTGKELTNPTPGDHEAIEEGREQYVKNCQACHGADLEGDIGPELTDLGYSDKDLFMLLNDGIEGSMPGFAKIGATKLWQLVNYLNYGVKK